MKQWILIISIILIPFSVNAYGAGEEDAGFWNDNFRLTAGMKIWQIKWKATQVSGDSIDVSGQMFGPAVNLTFKNNFFVGINYYTGDKLDYDDVESKKTDTDFWMGYRFSELFAFFVGYKMTAFEQKSKHQYQGFSVDYIYSSDINGPSVGFMGHYPIKDSGWIISAIMAVVYLEEEREGRREDYSGSYDLETITSEKYGPAFDIDLTYMFRRIPQLSLTAGYKLQYYQDTENSNVDETFSGVSFGVNYSF